ncbi:FAD/NAD(P)-binding domain-containing protein [Pseudovirgaria hyperparasitica]|uniref:FAD/NAD(P)-binding domain-containing protein n=1 Tax=Pseudovirgaria hyperparasitica TaxID=470096 RepID=A0A6A6WLJ1_9PEZI|nr:FAD/NAD(P)-binding domain-containing protein [Pseudovirgaria hyperparasitica]KAF2763051.1 FAD/NAD(P)-binding domain-containing protein [Pseudovirgaria hyperparasitica]
MVSSVIPESISIIGASVGGLTLGIVLKKYGIQPRIFESREPGYDFGGAVSLTPSTLRIIDSIGAYSRIKPQGFSFEAMTFLTDPERETTGKFYFGHKDVYGYDGLRITRKALLHELTEMANDAGVEINYGKKFTKIVNETTDGVIFEFADGSQEKAQMLIGSDGIHSKVRSCIFPDIHPHYSGFIGLTYCFPRDNVRIDEGFPLPVSLRGSQGDGAIMLQPQTEGGKEIFVGRQFKFEEKDRSGWDSLLQEKKTLIATLQRDSAAWTPLIQNVLAQASTPEAHFLNVWPFYTVPKMERWHSSAGKVLIIGDAAHAIPPSAGQGANQAFEDGYSLAIFLASLKNVRVSLLDALKTWEAYRMKRVDDVLKITNRLLTIRMTEEELASVPKHMQWELDGSEAGKSQLGWLYLADIDRDIKSLVESLHM